MAASYTILDQQHAYVYRPNGTRGEEWTVFAEGPGGVKFSFPVAGENYTAENVATIAQTYADRIAAVSQLGKS